MRHGSSNRRGRKRSNNGGNRRGGNNRSHVFDSNGPDVRIRGTAHQVAEKYETLAKDAAASGDITMEQSYLQYAEHYVRIIATQEENNKSKSEKNSNDFKNTRTKQRTSEDDLSLPTSILGDEVKASSNAEEVAVA